MLSLPKNPVWYNLKDTARNSENAQFRHHGISERFFRTPKQLLNADPHLTRCENIFPTELGGSPADRANDA